MGRRTIDSVYTLKDLRAVSCLIGLVMGSAAPTRVQSTWASADSATVRLLPALFPALPLRVRRDLERRGCQIPQVSNATHAREPHNVVRGAFTGPDRVDWAVLCSVRDTSQILLYHDNAAAATDSLARAADLTYLQDVAPGRIGFSRVLSAASAAHTRERAKVSRRSAPPPAPLHRWRDARRFGLDPLLCTDGDETVGVSEREHAATIAPATPNGC